MINEHQEELAALHALDLLDEAGQRELASATALDQELDYLIQDFDRAASLLAFSAPQIAPPRHLKAEIISEINSAVSKTIPFSLSTVFPYALAACFLLFGLYEAGVSSALKTELAASGEQITQLRNQNSFQQVRLAQLEAQDAKYKQASVVLAWNPVQQTGVISASNLPAAPAGHDYQLWALPTEQGKGPVSAGVVGSAGGPQPFILHGPAPSATAGQGFAISVEPSGGSHSPTGQIIFVSAH